MRTNKECFDFNQKAGREMEEIFVTKARELFSFFGEAEKRVE